MLTYFVILALGLMFIYSLRDALLILQNRRDERESRKAAASGSAQTSPVYIIQQNPAECKRFEHAS